MPTKLQHYLSMCPVVAILRGVRTDEIIPIAQVLIDKGVRILEVPLNSPSPFDTIKKMVDIFGDQALIGAGTVIQKEDIKKLYDIGARLVVSPHSDPELIRAAMDLDMEVLPGFFTPTEAFSAIRAGAQYLKFFPGQISQYKAIKAVLPTDVQVLAVGGVNASNLKEWHGIAGFGVGSSLYRKGDTPEIVAQKADLFLKAVGSRK